MTDIQKKEWEEKIGWKPQSTWDWIEQKITEAGIKELEELEQELYITLYNGCAADSVFYIKDKIKHLKEQNKSYTEEIKESLTAWLKKKRQEELSSHDYRPIIDSLKAEIKKVEILLAEAKKEKLTICELQFNERLAELKEQLSLIENLQAGN